jgi:hypothetical protein
LGETEERERRKAVFIDRGRGYGGEGEERRK